MSAGAFAVRRRVGLADVVERAGRDILQPPKIDRVCDPWPRVFGRIFGRIFVRVVELLAHAQYARGCRAGELMLERLTDQRGVNVEHNIQRGTLNRDDAAEYAI